MNIKKMLDGMLNKVFGLKRSGVTSKDFKLSAPPRDSKMIHTTKNHSKKSDKKQRKMSASSRKINRRKR